MKRLIVMIAMVAMIISISGCSGPKPEDTVKKFFTATKTLDIEAMAKCIVPSNTESIEKTTTLTEEKEDDYTKYFLDYLKTNAGKMTYKITSSEVNGEKAVITVESKYVNGGPLLKATISEAFTKAIGMAFSGVEPTEEETSQMFVSIMKEQVSKLDETFKTATIKINCVKKDGTWYIAEVNDDLLDVAMSGFISTGKEISDAFNGDETTNDDSANNPKEVLQEINNYVIDDLWNKGFCDIKYYLETGKGTIGQELDIDFTKSQLDKAMAKKDDYDKYIAELGNEYADLKEVWNKLSPQIDSLYQKVQSAEKSLNTDRFTQYQEAFSDIVYEMGY